MFISQIVHVSVRFSRRYAECFISHAVIAASFFAAVETSKIWSEKIHALWSEKIHALWSEKIHALLLGQACGVKKIMHALRSAHSVINRF